MPKLAEKEARGTTETVEDCCVRLRLACSAYASVAAVSGRGVRGDFFPCQSVSVHCSRVTAGTWYSVAWQMSVFAHT